MISLLLLIIIGGLIVAMIVLWSIKTELEGSKMGEYQDTDIYGDGGEF